ncbi:hypothetical protein J7L48_03455, partial [bacterium]|nr:hypothetical protein [bacterium]
MKKFLLLFFLFYLLIFPFAFKKLEKAPYTIEIPKFIYKMINKHHSISFEYICNKNNIFYNHSYVKFQKLKKKR